MSKIERDEEREYRISNEAIVSEGICKWQDRRWEKRPLNFIMKIKRTKLQEDFLDEKYNFSVRHRE